jgi:hypothetical protein
MGQPAQALEMLAPYLKVCGCQQAEALRPAIQAARRMLAESN